uniref:Uncharacterized protein n=1 Tax=Arundo donax TaxID=35708 RepID=A0A0A9AZ62_ARUDO
MLMYSLRFIILVILGCPKSNFIKFDQDYINID